MLFDNDNDDNRGSEGFLAHKWLYREDTKTDRSRLVFFFCILALLSQITSSSSTWTPDPDSDPAARLSQDPQVR